MTRQEETVPSGDKKGGWRLAKETSPYLQQHAGNPVEWWAWGEAAFAEARRLDVPIFLSVGYATCYWCHVMERESFEDAATAKAMNERFVNIKVDREERPDVDAVYMAATQALNRGQGGWPMSVFIEPEGLRPFYAGTYFPPVSKFGRPSFGDVLGTMSRIWRGEHDEHKRADLMEQAESVSAAVERMLAIGSEGGAVRLGEGVVVGAADTLMRMLDRANGGFGGAPKFPQPVFAMFLMDLSERTEDEGTRRAADAAVRLTLDGMARGGMFDQVGGGFHRYSVDERWDVPHFEKMLYDNGQLLELYARAYERYGVEEYARTARRTAAYVLAEMRAAAGAGEGGGFYSAQDAEVDHREGLNYLWTRAQVEEAVGGDGEMIALAVTAYGLDRPPNFRDPHHPEDEAAYVLRLAEEPARLAGRLGVSEGEMWARLDALNARLYAARAERKAPATDDKVLSAWNGLMIAGLARASSALNDPRLLEAAKEAAGFVWTRMRREDGVLLRTSRGGRAHVEGFLEDYACMIHGLIAVHRTGGDGDGVLLGRAERLAEEADRLFSDEAGGVMFERAKGRGELFVRTASVTDGAMPSGVSVMLHGLLDLFELTGKRRWLERAVKLMGAASERIAAEPVGAVNSTRAVLRLMSGRFGAELSGGLPGREVEEAEPRAAMDEVVQVFASVERVEVGVEKPAAFEVQLRIAAGYHINAARVEASGPGGARLVPTRVGIVNGTGVAAYADYPDGEAGGVNGEIRVYRGVVRLPIVLERSGEWSGRPLLALTYQACTETACLEPVTVELDVAIDRE